MAAGSRLRGLIMAKRTKKAAPVIAENAPQIQPKPELHPALAANQWKPGQSGNPAGKPKGARNKLSEAFVAALFEDFEEANATGESNGKAAIAKVRAEEPGTYLKVIAALAPKQIHIKEDVLDAFDDDELTAAMAAVRAIREARGAGEGDSPKAATAGRSKPH